MNRRKFLKSAAATVAAPYVIPSSVFGANERVAVGCIGVRNQGKGNLQRFQNAGCDIVAICDVDANVRAEAAQVVDKAGGKPELYEDYRKLLDREDIDAVVVTTPDHWHALLTIHACQAGKDVYCEKPLSLTIAEGRRMVQAARDNNRIVQTGSQQRSSSEFWKACTLVRNGAIGEIEQVLVGIPGCNHPGKLGPNTEPPSELNYDMWLGPAPERPYNEKRVHYNFRFWWDYSGGQMTNFGAHHLDIAQWGLGRDDSGPVAVEGTATYHPEQFHEVTETCRIAYTYDDGVKVIVGQGQDDIPGGATFIGTEGRIFVNRGKLTSDPADVIEQDVSSLPTQLYQSTNHVGNFLDCIRSRELPICDVEIGHRSATVCHLGNIVARLGRSIEWDPASEQIVGDSEAQAMTDKEYRRPWRRDMKFVAS
ncbi:MAG: gfo/Idh/MocA family oxidoreductase [Planctomycetota bacterium]|nr:MAG: gfo/Idh/MocA family oxidoreductase [Planctomycetota bacterium]REK20925.1 MAG: gfo/Idh/MocA family oxidoreductase [Planctomycetota bacterium]REK37294.1 MAG: gfo/Idh/MocA family oxidoreductase [Planctomycetota bacterium]